MKHGSAHKNYKHGHRIGRGSRTYRSWQSMKARCTKADTKDYKNYGGRGIKFCKKWKQFAAFLADMGERPQGKTLDRINNNKGYSKLNCKWSTRLEQAKNRRDPSGGTSKIKGVSFKKSDKVWVAQVWVINKTIYLGCYKTEKEAIKVVQEYRRKHDQQSNINRKRRQGS